jgi:hypothetical protein
MRASFWLTLAMIFLCFTARAEVSKEYQVKAAFLYNFVKFTNWKPERFATPESPIVIGILGRNPFGDELEKIVKDRNVNNRPIEVKLVNSLEEATSCHVLFVSAASFSETSEILQKLGDACVLTVGESEAFAQAGGMITFVPEKDKIRFEIDAPAAEHQGVKISAQLQKLAKPSGGSH